MTQVFHSLNHYMLLFILHNTSPSYRTITTTAVFCSVVFGLTRHYPELNLSGRGSSTRRISEPSAGILQSQMVYILSCLRQKTYHVRKTVSTLDNRACWKQKTEFYHISSVVRQSGNSNPSVCACGTLTACAWWSILYRPYLDSHKRNPKTEVCQVLFSLTNTLYVIWVMKSIVDDRKY